MKHLQDISLVVVGFLAFALIGYFIHTLANYNYCEREHSCLSLQYDSKGNKILQECEVKVCNKLPSDEVLNNKSKPYEPPTPQGLR